MTADTSDVLGRLVSRLAEQRVDYCVVGGLAVNATSTPSSAWTLTWRSPPRTSTASCPGSAPSSNSNAFPTASTSPPGSDLRVQFQLDPRYAAFVPRAERRIVLGVELPVARLEDVLKGKIWAAGDETRRPSKRQKDLADISRILESYPQLRPMIPADILGRLL